MRFVLLVFAVLAFVGLIEHQDARFWLVVVACVVARWLYRDLYEEEA